MTQLTLGERYEISILHQQGVSKAAIGRKLGRDRSTISREIKRNSDGRNGQYKAELAQKKCFTRHKLKNKNKPFSPGVKSYVVNGLKKDYSPEQIKGCAIKNGIPCVSIERIYQFVWQDKKEGGDLYLHLRTRGKKYQKRGSKKAGRGFIPNRVDISQRPTVVDKKQRIGDLEIDLIIGKGHKGALLNINDRSTGMLKMGHILSKEAKDVELKTKELLEEWAPFLSTITSDNGKEFANHEKIAAALSIDYYFATPYHSWERGANENLNGLVRQYFPKGSNFEDLTDQAVKEAENILNNRPRKRYGFLTPNEVFAAAIDNGGLLRL